MCCRAPWTTSHNSSKLAGQHRITNGIGLQCCDNTTTWCAVGSLHRPGHWPSGGPGCTISVLEDNLVDGVVSFESRSMPPPPLLCTSCNLWLEISPPTLVHIHDLRDGCLSLALLSALFNRMSRQHGQVHARSFTHVNQLLPLFVLLCVHLCVLDHLANLVIVEAAAALDTHALLLA